MCTFISLLIGFKGALIILFIYTQTNLQFLSDQVNCVEKASTDGVRVPFGLVLVF